MGLEKKLKHLVEWVEDMTPQKVKMIKRGAVAAVALYLISRTSGDDDAHIFDLRLRPLEIKTTSGSRDLQMVDIDVRVRSRRDPSAHRFPVINREFGRNINVRLLPSIVDETVKAVVAQYNASQLLSQREKVSSEIKELLAVRADTFSIVLDDVSVISMDVGKEYPATIHDVRARPYEIKTTSGSRDLQMVDIDVRVLSRPVADQLPTIHRELGQDYNDRVLPLIVVKTVKNVVAQYDASQLLSQREKVSDEIQEQMKKRAAYFHIVLDDVSITGLAFGKEYTAAIYDVRARPYEIKTTSGSRDLQMVDIDVRVLSHPIADQLPTIYRELGRNFNDRVLPSIVDETVKTVVAQYNASQLLSQREKVSSEILELMKKRAEHFHIVLDDVSITSLTIGKEYTAAIESKQIALQEAERLRSVVETANQEKQSANVRAQVSTSIFSYHPYMSDSIILADVGKAIYTGGLKHPREFRETQHQLTRST